MKLFWMIPILLLSGWTNAQGIISGTVFTPAGGTLDVYGTVVIACALTLDAESCDETLSGYAQISQGGYRAPFEIRGLTGDYYLLIAWQDTNGNGEVDEDEPQAVLLGGEEPRIITPPSAGLELHIQLASASAAPQAAQPTFAAGPVPNELLGNWGRGTVSTVDFYNRATGNWAPPSGSGSSYTFNPDGSFELGIMAQTSSYVCTMTLFSYKSGSYSVEGDLIVLSPSVNKFKSQDTCNEKWNYEREDSLAIEYRWFEIGIDGSGDAYLDVLELVMNSQGQLELKADAAVTRYYR